MRKILIADTDPAFRKALTLLIARRLDLNKYDVVEAADTGTLVQKLADERPELLILSWSIHGVPGPSICTLVRNTYPDLRVVLLSPNPEDEVEARTVGAYFICKGGSPEETLQTLNCVLAAGEE